MDIEREDNEEIDTGGITVADLLGGRENIITLYGYCTSCKEIHGDADRIVDYFQWMSNKALINFN